MMRAGLTSIVMVSYFTGPCLDAAIESVLDQPEPLELLVVDNGNPRDVVTSLQIWTTREPRLRVLSGHGNVGFGAACNLGALQASGEFLLLVNPDGVLPPDGLARFLAHAATRRAPFLIGPCVLDGEGREQSGSRQMELTPLSAIGGRLGLGLILPAARYNLAGSPLPAGLKPVAGTSGSCMFMRRADFWAIGGFDEGYFLYVEDVDLCLRFRRNGGDVLFAPDIAFRHLGGTSDAPRIVVERHKARGFRRYFATHFPATTWPVRMLLEAAISAQFAWRGLRAWLHTRR
jgi:GT2 family glycosyltransferase